MVMVGEAEVRGGGGGNAPHGTNPEALSPVVSSAGLEIPELGAPRGEEMESVVEPEGVMDRDREALSLQRVR